MMGLGFELKQSDHRAHPASPQLPDECGGGMDIFYSVTMALKALALPAAEYKVSAVHSPRTYPGSLCG